MENWESHIAAATADHRARVADAVAVFGTDTVHLDAFFARPDVVAALCGEERVTVIVDNDVEEGDLDVVATAQDIAARHAFSTLTPQRQGLLIEGLHALIAEGLAAASWGTPRLIASAPSKEFLAAWAAASLLYVETRSPSVDPAPLLGTALTATLRALFIGNAPTARLDRPSWLFTFCRDIVADHTTYLADHIVCVSDPAHHVLGAFLDTLVDAMGTVLRDRLIAVTAPTLFTHYVNEMLAFEAFFPTGLRSSGRVVRVLTEDPRTFQRWVRGDAAYAVDRAAAMPLRDVVKCARDTVHLVTAVASRYRHATAFLSEGNIHSVWDGVVAGAVRRLEGHLSEGLADIGGACDVVTAAAVLAQGLRALADTTPFTQSVSSGPYDAVIGAVEFAHDRAVKAVGAAMTTPEGMAALVAGVGVVTARVPSVRTRGMIFASVDVALFKAVFGRGDGGAAVSSRGLLLREFPRCSVGLRIAAMAPEGLRDAMDDPEAALGADALHNLPRDQVVMLCQKYLGLI